MKKILAIVLLALSFVFQTVLLYSDHKELFNALVMISMISGVALFPMDTQKNRTAKLIAAIGTLVLLTVFVLLIAVMNIP